MLLAKKIMPSTIELVKAFTRGVVSTFSTAIHVTITHTVTLFKHTVSFFLGEFFLKNLLEKRKTEGATVAAE